MKIDKYTKNWGTRITAAETFGTKFYVFELQDAIEEFKESNIILYYMLSTQGWNAIDFASNLFGSNIIDNKLVVCSTDGTPIEINGTTYDPEEVLFQDLTLDDISEYIEDSDDISEFVSMYEMQDNLDIEDAAQYLMNEGFSFMDIYHSLSDNDVI